MKVKKTPSGLTVSGKGKGKSLGSVLGPKVRIGVQSGLHAEESAAVTVSSSK